MFRSLSRISMKCVAGFLLVSFLVLFSGGGSTSAFAANSNGRRLRRQNKLALGASVLNFGEVVLGGSKVLTVTATNTTSSSLTISHVTLSSSDFMVNSPIFPLALAAGQSTTLSVQFSPKAPGTINGELSIQTDVPTIAPTLPLIGTAAVALGLTLNPASLNFGNVTSGSSETMAATVTNSTGNTVTIANLAASGAGFSVNGMSLPKTLKRGQSTTFHVTFHPASSGNASGWVKVMSGTATPAAALALSGKGVGTGALTASPATINFGSIVTGNSQSASETVTNNRGTSVTISSLSATGSGFSTSGISLPQTLGAGQSASFHVTFKPSASGSVSGAVTLISNASNATMSISLSGAGVSSGALSANPSSLSFGSVVDGSTQTQQATVSNTGGTSVTISSITANGTGFSVSGVALPKTLSAGQSVSISVSYKPTAPGSASGSVTITSNASQPTSTIPVTGSGVTPGALGASAATLSFGSVNDGTTASRSETLTNTGGSSITISAVSASGTGFSVSGLSLPATLAAGKSSSLNVTFAPTTSGAASGNLIVTSSATNPTVSVHLSGTGTAASGTLTVSPGSLSLGTVLVGSSKSASGNLTASGASVTVSAITSDDSAVFSVSGISLPATIPAGSSVPFTVTFRPASTGAASATLTVTSNSTASAITEALVGTGSAPPSHQISLSWDASSSSAISGYNVYRSTYNSACGSFSKINATLDTTTVFTDISVADGASYCYATTAVDSSGTESGYSNVVSNLQVPTN